MDPSRPGRSRVWVWTAQDDQPSSPTPATTPTHTLVTFPVICRAPADNPRPHQRLRQRISGLPAGGGPERGNLHRRQGRQASRVCTRSSASASGATLRSRSTPDTPTTPGPSIRGAGCTSCRSVSGASNPERLLGLCTPNDAVDQILIMPDTGGTPRSVPTSNLSLPSGGIAVGADQTTYAAAGHRAGPHSRHRRCRTARGQRLVLPARRSSPGPEIGEADQLGGPDRVVPVGFTALIYDRAFSRISKVSMTSPVRMSE